MTDPTIPDDDAVTADTLVVPGKLFWQVPLLLGVLHLLMGVALLVWPSATVTVVAVLLGLELVFGGVLRLVQALASNGEARVVRAVVGLLGVLAGLLVVSDPLRSVGAIVLVVGGFWVLWGLAEVFVAMTPSARDHRGPLAVEGLVALIGGGVLLAWPGPTVRVLTVFVGLLLLVAGALATWAGWRLRGAVASGA